MPIEAQRSGQFLSRIKKRLEAEGFDTSDSSVVVMFSKIIADELGEQASSIEEAYNQSRLSSATGEGLDAIGQEKNVSRLPGESDDNYRYRLSMSFLAGLGGNPESIRQALLAVDGIKDVKFMPFTHGAGSATVMIIAHDPYQGELLLPRAEAAIKKAAPAGNRIEIALPAPRALGMEVQLTLRSGVQAEDRELLRENVRLAIYEYLSGLMPGEVFVLNELRARIMGVALSGVQTASEAEDVLDAEILSMTLDGERVTVGNIQVSPLERIVPDVAQGGIVIL